MSGRPATEAARGGRAAPPAPDWLTPDPDERLAWRGGPRIQTALPVVVVGAALVAVGAAALVGSLPVSAASTPWLAVLGGAAVVAGLVVAVGAYLRVSTVDYVVTDRALYLKRGVVSRTVTAVDYESVQNVAYAQGVAGTFLDYGTLTFDTAGASGVDLAFHHVDDPDSVRRLVDAQLERVRGGGRRLPGTPAQWAAVREEVAGIRRALDERRGE